MPRHLFIMHALHMILFYTNPKSPIRSGMHSPCEEHSVGLGVPTAVMVMTPDDEIFSDKIMSAIWAPGVGLFLICCRICAPCVHHGSMMWTGHSYGSVQSGRKGSRRTISAADGARSSLKARRFCTGKILWWDFFFFSVLLSPYLVSVTTRQGLRT